MDAIPFLDRGLKNNPLPLYVVHGDEDFLKRRVLAALRTGTLGPDDGEGGLSVHAGDKATFAGVFDDLQTAAFFSPRRLVLVENADPFVTRYRTPLEKMLPTLKGPNVLVLDVKTWAGNTRLAKMTQEAAVVCKAPAGYRLPQWAMQWSQSAQDKQLTQGAAELLVDLVGQDMGQLDQELLKLAIYVGNRKRIDENDVDRLVGRSREETTWKIFEVIGAGQQEEAFKILDRLFDQGEDPIRLLGAFSMKLRQLAQAYRLNQIGQPLPAALAAAGVPPFAVKAGEQQLKHLGRRRLDRLYDWLLELDQGLKGGNPLPPRTQLERLVARLARRLH